jgi:hypothetical protein
MMWECSSSGKKGKEMRYSMAKLLENDLLENDGDERIISKWILDNKDVVSSASLSPKITASVLSFPFP